MVKYLQLLQQQEQEKAQQNVVQIGRIEGMSGLKSTLSDLYTDR